jgi:hypothetical protein
MPKPTSHRPYIAGKGSWRRDAAVPEEEIAHNWDRIFGRRSCLGCEDLESTDDGNLICIRCHEYVDNVKEPPCES